MADPPLVLRCSSRPRKPTLDPNNAEGFTDAEEVSTAATAGAKGKRKPKALLDLEAARAKRKQDELDAVGSVNAGDTDSARLNAVDLDEPSTKRPRNEESARSPLPTRASRPAHPGEPDMPRRKRSSDEVAAAKALQEDLDRQIRELEQHRKESFALMEVEEEEAEEEEQRASVRRLSDLPILKTKGSESEDVEFVEESDEESVDENSKTRKTKSVSPTLVQLVII